MTKAKSKYYDAHKLQIIYDFSLNNSYYDARKNRKKHALKTSPRENQTTMMSKIYNVLRGNRSFFFCMTVSVKLGRNFAVSRVLGVENLKPMVVSLKLGVLAMLKAEGLSHRQNPPVSMNTTIGFQVFIPPEHVNYCKLWPKFR